MLFMNFHSKLSQVYYKANRLQQIRGFCNVVIYEGITEAAKVMNLTKSTVSLQIRSLERDLKKTLVKRSRKNSKKFELTEDGKIFFELALPVLNNVDSLCDRFFLSSSRYSDSFLRIAGHHSVFSIFLPKALKKIKDENEDLSVQLSYLQKYEAFERAAKGELDLAIYPIEDPDSIPRNLDFKKIAAYRPALITPLGHQLNSISDEKITFEEIGKYNFVHTGNYAISDIMKYQIASKTLMSFIDINYGSWDILKSLVAAGLGVTIFHEDYCKNDQNVCVKKVYHLSPNIAYYAVFQKGGGTLKRLVLELLELISD